MDTLWGGVVPAVIYGTNNSIHSNNGFELVLAQTPLMVFVNGNFFVFIFSILSGFTIGINYKKHLQNNDLDICMVKRYFGFSLPIFLLGVLCLLMQKAGFFFTASANVYANSGMLENLYNDPFTIIEIVKLSFVDIMFTLKGSISPALWMLNYIFVGSFVCWIVCFITRYNQHYRGIFQVLLSLVFCMIGKILISAMLLGLLLSDFTLGFDNKSKTITKYGHIFMKLVEGLKSVPIAVLCLLLGLLIGGYPCRETVRITNFYKYMTFLGYEYWYLIGGLLVVYGISQLNGIKRILSGTVMNFLGKISFEIYLIHFPLFASLSCFVFAHLNKVNFKYYYSVLITYVISTFVLLFVSYIVHTTINKQLYSMIDKLSRVICRDKNSTNGG